MNKIRMATPVVACAGALCAALLVDIALAGTSTLSATSSTKRVATTVETTTLVVAPPVVETKVAATATTAEVWVAEPQETLVSMTNQLTQEPIRPYLPIITALISLDCDGNGVPDGTQISAGAMDWDSDGVLDTCEYAIGDLNLNGVIDQQDLSILLGWWGIANPVYGDLNNDNAVNATDLGILLGRFGAVVY